MQRVSKSFYSVFALFIVHYISVTFAGLKKWGIWVEIADCSRHRVQLDAVSAVPQPGSTADEFFAERGKGGRDEVIWVFKLRPQVEIE